MALYIPHNSVLDLLTIDDEKREVTEAYNIYFYSVVKSADGKSKFEYPELRLYQNNEIELDIFSNKRNKNNEKDNSNFVENDIDINDEDVEYGNDTNSIISDLDCDNYSIFEMNCFKNLQKLNAISWNG